MPTTTAASPARPPTRDAHRLREPHEDLDAILLCKEPRKLTQNLTVQFQRTLLILEASPRALALRGTAVEVRERADGHVAIDDGGVALPARLLSKEGCVWPQDIAGNKHLAAALE